MAEEQKLPRWKSHKVVEAFKIGSITPHPLGCLRDGGATIYGEIPPAGLPWIIDVSREFMEKHQPKVGGYYVRYKDGYESFSPAEAFEEGYIKLDDERLAGTGRCASGLSMLLDHEAPNVFPGKITVIPAAPDAAFLSWVKELYKMWSALHGPEKVKP